MATVEADKQALAERAVQAIYAPDRASQALDMQIVAVGPRAVTVTMTVRPEMTNGFGTCHGGLIFTLADSAFAFACNSDGQTTVAATAAIDFLRAARVGDELTATARELWRGGRSGIYEVIVTDQTGAQVALFRGRSHRVGNSGTEPRDPS